MLYPESKGQIKKEDWDTAKQLRNRIGLAVQNMRRPQSTIANNKLSNPELVTCGVSQGSILCPLFFLVNINDLMSSLKLVSVQMQGGGGAGAPTHWLTVSDLDPMTNIT